MLFSKRYYTNVILSEGERPSEGPLKRVQRPGRLQAFFPKCL
jgi:hypothetical protein